MFSGEVDALLKEEEVCLEELVKHSQLEKNIQTLFYPDEGTEEEVERPSKAPRLDHDAVIISAEHCLTFENCSSVKSDELEENVPRNKLDDFSHLHHLTRTQVEALFKVLGPHYSNPGRRAPLKEFVITSLVVLSTKNNYRELNESKLFKSRGWMHKTLHQFCKMIVEHLSEMIEWPSNSYARDTIRDFESIVGFPGVIGSLDTCHMPITKAPVGKCSKLYSNPMLFHSIHLLAIADAKSRFTYINIGRPGSLRESQVLESTSLWKVMETEPAKLFSQNTHLIADSAFPLTENLIAPYPVNINMNSELKNFNGAIYATRKPIDLAFELLRSRWKRLRCLEMDEVRSMVNLVRTCCILHNICTANEEYMDRNYEMEEKEDMEVEYAGHIPSCNAVQKREMLCMYMNGQATLQY